MDTKQYVLYLYADTTLHAGTGTGLGAVDLPIQREKHTDYPIIQASGVKGALRNTAELGLSKDDIRLIFGGATGSKGEDFAGAMSPSDARILLFPVRALNGVFVWITSPTVLARYQQDAGVRGDIPDMPESSALVSDNGLLINGQVMLEEYTYTAQADRGARAWADHLADHALPAGFGYWQERLRKHFVILPDNEFRDFVKYSTEIVTRIHLDDVKKTVRDGQLFSQELLPADSLLYSVVQITSSRDGDTWEKSTLNAGVVWDKLEDAIGSQLQIGADETVGRGRMRLNWQEVK